MMGKIYAHAVIIDNCNDNALCGSYKMWCGNVLVAVPVQIVLFVIEANVYALTFIIDSLLFKLTAT
jgi:hypothetical protein